MNEVKRRQQLTHGEGEERKKSWDRYFMCGLTHPSFLLGQMSSASIGKNLNFLKTCHSNTGLDR